MALPGARVHTEGRARVRVPWRWARTHTCLLPLLLLLLHTVGVLRGRRYCPAWSRLFMQCVRRCPCADAVTKEWLRANMDKLFGFPSLVRFSWSTCRDLLKSDGVAVKWCVIRVFVVAARDEGPVDA